MESIQRQRAVVVFGLFVRFHRLLSENQPTSSCKAIIDLLFEKRLLSRLCLRRMVALTHHGPPPLFERLAYSLDIRREVYQPYAVVHSAIERCVELWSRTMRCFPSRLSLRLDPPAANEELDLSPAVIADLIARLPSPPHYGFYPGEIQCAVCGSEEQLRPCPSCQGVSYCGDRCRAAHEWLHRKNCSPGLALLLSAATEVLR